MKKRRTSAAAPEPEEIRVEQGFGSKKGKDTIRVALVYPNTYSAGMSSLGFQTVYKLANRIANVSCERVFLPDRQKKGTIKPIRSRESGLELIRFDLIMFSISFENDFMHLAQLLVEAGIPLRSHDRNHTHPIVVAGGVACFLNPLPISPFIDLFLLGEAECLLEPFFCCFEKHNRDRKTILEKAPYELEGIWVPGYPVKPPEKKVKVQYLENLETVTTTSAILTHQTAFKDTFLIETMKGCPHGCRFCSAGFIYRPPRHYPAENIRAAMDAIEGQTDRIGLVSSAIADHPEIDALCRYGNEKGFQLSFSSLRADKIKGDLLKALTDAHIKTATIAPEAGSQRMRQIINKHINEKDILNAAENLVNADILNLRLYFMIGLPFETDDDVTAIADLTIKVKKVFLEASRKKKKMGTITLSVNPFIPKPATPFQWAPMARPNVLKKRSRMLKERLKKIPNVRINIESLKQARIHALLSCADSRAADIIETALQKGWNTAVKEHQDYCDKLLYREKDLESPLAWDFLQHHVSPAFLKKEYLKARSEKLSPPCPMYDCSRCKTCI